MTTRRLFLTGSAAAVLTAPMGYTLFAQQQAKGRPSDPLVRELRRQLRQGIEKTLDMNGDGTRQLATTIRIYAATQVGIEAELRKQVKAKGRNAVLAAPFKHSELERFADELGYPKRLLPPHDMAGLAGKEKGLDLLLAEGISPLMGRAADALDQLATILDERASRTVRVAARQCDCDSVCNLVDAAEAAMTGACAIAAIFPPAAEVCAAACATYLSVVAACGVCRIGVAIFC